MPTQLAPSLYRIHCRGVNAYVVDGEEPTLVDGGTPIDAGRIRSALEDIGLAPHAIERVLLTHWDVDHVGALAKLGLDAPVYAGRFDGDVLAGRRKPPLSNRKGVFQRVTGLFAKTPSLDVRAAEDGDEVGPFTAYHTPGHTPDHTVFVAESLDVAFLGDLVMESDGALEPSPWYLSYDSDAVAESVVDLAARAPEFEVACVGHGDPITSGGKAALDDLAEAVSRAV